MADITRHIADETLILTPERGVFWERGRVLFITDMHWGGVQMTSAMLAEDLRRLSALIARFETKRLIILGDLIDNDGRDNAPMIETISQWRHRQRTLPISLIRGDQERKAGDPPLDLNIDVVDGPTPGPYFVLSHEPHQLETGYALAGHLHPAQVIDGHKVPCYRFGKRCLTLPAFGSGVDHQIFDPDPDDEVLVVTN